MQDQELLNYYRVADAIDYIRSNFKTQPDLEKVAEAVNMSAFHFQRLFTEWAGVSPKKFLQYISLEHARGMLREKQASLFDTAIETGLSGTGRLHDLFISMEAMTPGEFKNGGEELLIYYSYADTIFGKLLLASTSKGICHIAFADDEVHALNFLQQKFPKASYRQMQDALQKQALGFFTRSWDQPEQLKLHLKGTPFQLKVWEALLKIPAGRLMSYGAIAKQIAQPTASRAVGTAIGDNPIAYLIPCHRVIQSGGEFGNYHWGSTRKTALIGWEAALTETNSEK